MPILRFESKVEEAVTALDVGYITNHQKQEIIISTYSGKIMALQDKSHGKSVVAAGDVKA